MKKGDLVKMKTGWSGPGILQEILKEHPRASEEQFGVISKRLKKRHVKVFWTLDQESEILPYEDVETM